LNFEHSASILHALYNATNNEEFGDQWQCPACTKNQLLNHLMAIVIHFKLCSTCYTALWMYKNMRSSSVINSAAFKRRKSEKPSHWSHDTPTMNQHLCGSGEERRHRGGQR